MRPWKAVQKLSRKQLHVHPDFYLNRLVAQKYNIIEINSIFPCFLKKVLCISGRVGLVVRALAFHQCGPGSISALGVICGLSLLVLYSAMRGFPPGTPVFPSHQKPTFDLISFDL